MRVLWITPGFAADENDHNCIPPLQSLARALVHQGIDLQIISIDYPLRDQPYTWNGIPVVSACGIKRKWFRGLNWIKVIRYALDLNKNNKFDVIHSFWFGPSWLIGQYLKTKWMVAHYTTLMGQDVLNSNLYLYLLRKDHLNSMIAVSGFQNDAFEKATGHRAAYTLGWGLDEADFPSEFNEKRPLDVLGCGSLIALKNWELWVEVIAKIVVMHPGLSAEIIGEGPEHQKIMQLIEKANLTKQIQLRGSLPRPQVLQRMREAKVFLHTARFESFGLVLAEAAANGCTVISSPTGIAPEMAYCGHTSAELFHHINTALSDHLLPYSPDIKRINEIAVNYIKLYRQETLS